MEYLSTTNLAASYGVETVILFEDMSRAGWINRVNNKWQLTGKGKQIGGIIKSHPKYGEYIAWPENINLKQLETNLINATTIGNHFKISSQRMNLVLSELGWIQKNVAGWQITRQGEKIGGVQCEHENSGASFVLWPEEILHNKNLITVFNDSHASEKQHRRVESEDEYRRETSVEAKSNIDFRDKFPPTHRTKDGHMARSRAEVIIDNALYDYKLAHAYERKLPIEENLYSDFFIPSENVYIEYWGLENDPKYLERKKAKLDIYRKYDFKLIELTDDDISNLDDHLPKKLLKFGIKVY
ncbi:MAG: glycerol kinase [Flavobacterium sp.]|nr:MAG: glycerol kinase [Flavobacterium sp.]